MRRLFAGFLIAALLLAPALASAQIGAGAGQAICETRASANAGNTATAVTLFSCAVPAGAGGSPMHVSLMGTISEALGGAAQGQSGSILFTCNYGGANASVTLANLTANAFNFGLASAPWTADVWYRPVASVGASGQSAISSTAQFMVGKFSFASQTAGTQTVGQGTVPFFASYTMGYANGFVDNLGAQTFACNWQWASANANNFMLMNHGIMTIGN